MTNKEHLTKLKELKEKVERDIIESKILAETLLLTMLYTGIEEQCKELELKIEEENKPTIEEIRLEAIAKELTKLNSDNMSCGGVSCTKCIFNINDEDCEISNLSQTYIKAKNYLNKLEKGIK